MMLSRQPTKVSNEWELDFYSRPVQGPDGKKLWELLVTDAQGTFQHVEAVPSNCVNSRELRSRVHSQLPSQLHGEVAEAVCAEAHPLAILRNAASSGQPRLSA